MGSMIDPVTFQSLRGHLFSVAYRMLSSAAEAEDMIQDAWLRSANAPQDLASARAWLTTVVTRLCLDRLKAARTQRETYVGPWFPEPVPTEAIETGEDVVTRRESVTMAFLVLLETLTPAERAAFLLREIFDADYAEVAKTLETSSVTARQLVHRAKTRIAEGRPRFDVSPEHQQEIVAQFFEALQAGDLSRLEQYLAADVEFAADGGGKAPAARRPILGAPAVGRLMISLYRTATGDVDDAAGAWTTHLAGINGEAALVVYRRDTLDSVFVFSTDDERITAIRVIRNPDKLAWLAEHAGFSGS
jgi:RNA polymerase sigma factor (sigma-70 family)